MEGGAGKSGGIVHLISFLITVPLLLQSSTAISVGSGSLKAELFHRDHPFARLRSSKPPDDSTSGQTTVDDAPLAEYLMSISLGTPPQNFVAVADTGSDLAWVQCEPCENCFNQSDPVFDPSLSSTFKNLSCSSTGCSSFLQQYPPSWIPSCDADAGGRMCDYVGYVYGDGSNTTGSFGSETLNLKSSSGGSVPVADFWFGCSHSSFSPVGTFDLADGLIGLGRGLISLPSQLGHIFEDKFSYCLVNKSVAGVQSSPLVFGNDAAAKDLELQYTPLLSSHGFPYSSFYYVGIEDITVNGVPVDYNQSLLAIDSDGNGGTIIDSGTDISRFDPRVMAPLLAAMNSTAPSCYPRFAFPGFPLCFNVTEEANYMNDLPKISFKLTNNSWWDLDFINAWYFIGDGGYCFAILSGAEGGTSILGNYQQQDFYVLFDRVTNRIGFTKTDCGAESFS